MICGQSCGPSGIHVMNHLTGFLIVGQKPLDLLEAKYYQMLRKIVGYGSDSSPFVKLCLCLVCNTVVVSLVHPQNSVKCL